MISKKYIYKTNIYFKYENSFKNFTEYYTSSF